jgi:hypothetical protein
LKIFMKNLAAVGILLFCINPQVTTYAASEYIGYDTQGGFTSTLSPSYCWGNKYSTDFYAANGGEVIDTFIIWCNPQNNNNKLVFGVYTVSGGAIQTKSYVSDTLTLSGNSIARWVIPANYSLTSGNTYTLCVDVAGFGGPAVCYGSLTNGLSRNNNSSFPSTWSDDLSNNMRYSVAAHFSTKKATSILRRRSISGGEK